MGGRRQVGFLKKGLKEIKEMSPKTPVVRVGPKLKGKENSEDSLTNSLSATDLSKSSNLLNTLTKHQRQVSNGISSKVSSHEEATPQVRLRIGHVYGSKPLNLS
eukprot:CAMPEP_0197018076 /NCGR_PEP_ID=MMETSP1380-20130617/79896_1 /TAXON_ID=5936 /ORGANISM="Euplotes crassus, Strain CT5" /LENGTH=103 /DNA_ID=CAMNT_0042445247 /DNA_START=457 /DNA_END=768 /DNA_ORIENTATION=-